VDRHSAIALLGRLGLDVRRRRPFGVSWEDDLRFYRPRLDVAVDVGAHQGETALRLLGAFAGVQVHAFEPMPESFRHLEAAVDGQGVRCVNAAVGEASGVLTMAEGVSSQHSGVHGAGPRIEVPVTTLDAYAAEAGLETVDLLKVDVEGHEAEVLRGAMGLLSGGRVEHVLCECEFVRRGDEPHGDFHEIFALLAPLGYRVVAFYANGVDNLGWLWGDVLFLRAGGSRDGWYASSPVVGARPRLGATRDGGPG
jgi:FkbM family methyltransferase